MSSSGAAHLWDRRERRAPRRRYRSQRAHRQDGEIFVNCVDIDPNCVQLSMKKPATPPIISQSLRCLYSRASQFVVC